MNKLFSFAIIALLAMALVGCGQKATDKQEIVQKEASNTGATSSDAVSSANQDLQNVNDIEQDLSSDELSDVDSGLADIENI